MQLDAWRSAHGQSEMRCHCCHQSLRRDPWVQSRRRRKLTLDVLRRPACPALVIRRTLLDPAAEGIIMTRRMTTDEKPSS